MSKKRNSLLVGAAILASIFSSQGNAESVSLGEFYMGASLFSTFLNDQDASDVNNSIPFTSEFDNGLGGAVSLGGVLNKKYRMEIEAFSFRNEVNKVTRTDTGAEFNAGGGSRHTALMANLFFDPHRFFDIQAPTWFQPYVGGGLGAAVISSYNNPTTGLTALKTRGVDLGYQIMAGFNFQISEQAKLRLGYRYYNRTSDNGIDSGGSLIESKTDIDVHIAELGISFYF